MKLDNANRLKIPNALFCHSNLKDYVGKKVLFGMENDNTFVLIPETEDVWNSERIILSSAKIDGKCRVAFTPRKMFPGCEHKDILIYLQAGEIKFQFQEED